MKGHTEHSKWFILTWLTGYLLLTTACRQDAGKPSVIFQADEEETTTADFDLPELEQNGELIAVTLSGPDTYFEWRGQGFGDQYELAAHFARSQGLRIRMELAHDTTEMLEMVRRGDADVAALPIHRNELEGNNLADAMTALRHCAFADTLGWVVRENAPLLSQALMAWYEPGILQRIIEQRKQMARKHDRRQSTSPKHTPKPKVKDAAQGIISDYDALFRRHAPVCGWDWRLLAAQCYQESAFDPNAVSWAGAQGLMQLMPATASGLGLSGHDVFVPDTNIGAAARLIADLNKKLAEVSDSGERIKFILASYNGGLGHVRDAMALCQKYGGDKHHWADVNQYILLLSDAQYYRDPVVKCGYLRGTETSSYVTNILSHWEYYRSVAH